MKYINLKAPRDFVLDPDSVAENELRFKEICSEFNEKPNTTANLIRALQEIGLTEVQIQFVMDNTKPNCNREILQKKYLKLLGEAYKAQNWKDLSLYWDVCFTWCTSKQMITHSKEI